MELGIILNDKIQKAQEVKALAKLNNIGVGDLYVYITEEELFLMKENAREYTRIQWLPRNKYNDPIAIYDSIFICQMPGNK